MPARSPRWRSPREIKLRYVPATRAGTRATARASWQTESWINGLAFSPDGKILASGCGDNIIRLWDATTLRLLASLRGHAGAVAAVAFAPDGKTLATGSEDGTVKLWSLAAGQEVATLTGHTGAVTSLAFAPDGDTLASASDDKTVRIWRAIPLAAIDGKAENH